ncbi:Alpha-N-arabinofuranosidase [[Clostridium] cellulosi]|jgi:Alpha-L-arabinofuranosidase C-terminus.|uniref:non-reducing end alpha-L-arabinofuranosidase n=1 Tax=[Clostridium] cellulosi TaxID=29343 RepID=A0A078KS43_9FIRM|nr:Alpha-N-arabinofuranosidase [[Clostridium] cellulosi]
MKRAKLLLDKDLVIAPVDDRLFSSFLEHLGRAIYSGIYEPGHPDADEEGFRKDVLDMIRELNVSYIRYPGGNFVSGYDWKDGIGPVDERPVRLDLAWHSIESNKFGIDEFVDWSKKAGTKIMGAVNMGTGTPKEAAQFVEYCNYPGGTMWSDLRIKNGHKQPHNIKLWCIGNEMDGPWQICHLDAHDYGKKALATANIMKMVDSDIELVVCGSSMSSMPTFPEWDRIVLEHTYDAVDYLSLHMYYENFGNNQDFLASFVDMDRFIHTVAATADYVKALKRSKKTMYFSFDEWNVWYQHNQKPHPWQEAPDLLEDRYSMLDALVFGGLGITLLNNADRVKIACLAQLVNVIAPIYTQKGGKAIKQTIYYPFRDLSLYGRGTSLRSIAKVPKIETKYGDTPLIANAAVYNENSGEITVFAVNTDLDEPIVLDIDLRAFGNAVIFEHSCMENKDIYAVNTFDNPLAVVPYKLPVDQRKASRFEIKLPKASWNTIRFKVN